MIKRALIIALALIFLPGLALGAGRARANYAIPSDVFPCVGGISTTSTTILKFTLGQPSPAGVSSDSYHTLFWGFRYAFLKPISELTPSVDQRPVIDSFSANPTSGDAPLTVDFTCTAHDPDGLIDYYQMAYGDGSSASNEMGSFTYTYTHSGTYQAICTAVDDAGARTVSDPITIQVGQGVLSISHEANATYFEGGMDYGSNHLELTFMRPETLTQNVDLYISLAQPAAEGGNITYYFASSNRKITLSNGIYFNNASPNTGRVPYCTNCTMPDRLQLYGPVSVSPIFNDGWVVPRPFTMADGVESCLYLPDGYYIFTVEAYEPGTDTLLARGEATVTWLP